MRYTDEQIIKKIAALHESVKVVGKYSGYNSKIDVECKQCGYKWSPTVGSLLHGHGCPKCAGKKKKTHEEFLAELADINPSVECLGRYESAWDKILCRCRICGNEWKASPRKLLDGRSCPECAKRRTAELFRLSMTEVQKKISEIDSNVKIVGNYENNHKQIRLHCDKCEHDWKQTFHDFAVSQGCPNCHSSCTSFTEQFILETFRRLLDGEKVLSRDKSAIGMELDIYLPSLYLAIEPGAWRFHESTVARSIAKERLCREKGITLITIFDHCDQAEVPVNGAILVKQDLSRPKNFKYLQELTQNLVNRAGLDLSSFSTEDWRDIKITAHLNSRRMTSEEYKSLVEKKNHKVEVTGRFLKTSIPVEYRCKKCGQYRTALASSLLLGCGCYECFGNPIKTDEEFQKQLAERNPGIVALDTYIGGSTPIRFKCSTCGHIWKTAPNHLISSSQRTHCPKCSGRTRKTTDEFAAELAEINPNIDVIGPYVSRKKKVAVRCRLCNHEWTPLPGNLLKGSKCPICHSK